MAVIDTIRPLSVRDVGGATTVPSGTIAAVTSDNSDATYVDFNLADAGNNWSVRLESHTPAAGYQRHRLRGRIRIRTDVGTADEDIDVGRGTSDYINYDNVTATATFSEQATNWFQDEEFGLGTSGALADLNAGGGWMESALDGASEIRTSELYVDIDTRFRPDYSPEVRDNAGVDQSGGTVTDTTQPDLWFGAVAYDDLPARDWEVVVTSAGDEVFSSSGSGQPPSVVPMTVSLPDGPYVATFTVRSTIRGTDPFAYSEAISFSIENTIPPPSPPLIYVTEEFGGYRVSWVNPGGQAWDDDYVVAEVFRDDCTGSQRIATVPNGINGSYLDLAIPQIDHAPGCGETAEDCGITYRVRYWGYVSTYVELPDTIPEGMILGWPSTAGSIPSGWTRVTALDGRFPRGATGTGAPSATGGTATHEHTTPGHRHVIGEHSHPVGGNTGTSNASTTSARFNGASKAQADQPHSHARPSNTSRAAEFNTGTTSPGTSAVSNEPPSRTVIWIESDGTPSQYPVGVLGWATEAVSGWEADASSTGRYLKGAPAAGNGGTNAGASTHTHTVDAHTHTGVSHGHPIGNTGLSNPSSSQEAGTGQSTPRWLPRHTHPLSVSAASTGTTASASGGATSTATLEPPNRRLSVLRNTGGGTQTRIIGLYVGAVADLDPLLTLCDGAGGTPDMRSWFARDKGSDSINSTGGASTHNHTTAGHSHGQGSHSHTINVLESETSSFERPSFGDLGDSPTVNHDHSGGSTGSVDLPNTTNVTSGTTNSVSHVPLYREAHFVRLDGTISGGPLPVPELRVSEFSSAMVPAFSYGDDLDRLASFDTKLAVVTDRNHDFPRLVAETVPLDGGLHSVATTLAGEDMTLTMAVVGLPAINALEALLANTRLYYSPVGGTPGWYAPGAWRVTAPAPDTKVVTVPMVRQPWPTTDDPEVYL